jgi:glycosyltransferase involved in cell wall biosynthesis
MKILMANKFFFLNGGVEKYYRDLLVRLTETGHEPIPFSVGYFGNWDSAYSPFFLPPPDKEGKAHFKDIRIRPGNILRYLDRSIYSFEARYYLYRLIKTAGKIDAAYVFNIYNYMSPSIIDFLKEKDIPVIMQVGDYNLLCPCYTFLLQGLPCTLCLNGNYLHGLRYKCVKNSYPASLVRVLAMFVQRMFRVYHRVDAFTVPCLFMKEKMIQGGFDEKRIHLLRYPMSKKVVSAPAQKKDYILYFGRLSYEKGLDTLIAAFQKLGSGEELFIVGRSYDGEKERLQGFISQEFTERIHFLDFMEKKELDDWIAQALFTVVPSRWYDNAPLSIYESFQLHTPVVGADIGGIPEQIQDKVNGRLFTPGSVPELARAMSWMLEDRQRLLGMGASGAAFVAEHCDMDNHLDQLLQIFGSLKLSCA